LKDFVDCNKNVEEADFNQPLLFGVVIRATVN
jgi:hypothetical protein